MRLEGKPVCGNFLEEFNEFYYIKFWVVVVGENWLEVSFAMTSSIRSILNLERVESAMKETQ